MTATIWTVRVYEQPHPRTGRVTTQRYYVIAKSREDAIARAKTLHELPELLETYDARYVANDEGCDWVRGATGFMSRLTAESAIAVGLS